MHLGNIIKDFREKNNISMQEFADKCSLSKGYISMLENGVNPRNKKPIAPTLPSLRKISIGLGNRDLCLSNKYHSLFIHSR